MPVMALLSGPISGAVVAIATVAVAALEPVWGPRPSDSSGDGPLGSGVARVDAAVPCPDPEFGAALALAGEPEPDGL
jgi:hypothetical protein